MIARSIKKKTALRSNWAKSREAENMHTFQPNNNSSDCISQELLHICPRRCLIRNFQGISWGSSG